MTRKALLAALALACVASPAMADVAAGSTDVVVPWGTWLNNALLAVSTVAVPVLTGFAVKGIQQVAPWAALFLSNARVQAGIQQLADWGLNAVRGATKDQKLSVPIGIEVIAAAAQRAVDVMPQKVFEEAGGIQGIAERVFRTLHLTEDASAQQVISAAVAKVAPKGRLVVVGAKR